MPGSIRGKSSASRAFTRNPASGRYVIKTYSTTLPKFFKKRPSRTARPHVGADKIVVARETIDLGAHEELTKFHIKKLQNLVLSHQPSPALKVGTSSQASVDQFTNSVLSALKGILGARLETLAAADIDITSLGTPADVAEWMASALPASHPFDEIAGPFYDIEGVSRRLRVPHNEVLRYVEDGRLLGCPTAEGALVFPISQFNSDGSSVAGLERVVKTMATGTTDPWQIALWMNTPCEQLNDQTPAQTLQHGDTRIVEELAAQTAARWRH